MLGSVDEAVKSGEIRIAADVAAELRRMHAGDSRYIERPGDIGSPGELGALIKDAGLREYSLDVITRDVRLDGDESMKRVRALAVLGQAHNA